jgi:hypothetical protein
MIRIGVRSFVSAGGGTDADAQAFITAAGITDATQQSAINTLVTDLKDYGIWTKMKAIYPFVGGTASSHKWNLKDPRDLDAAFRLVFSGGWTHSSNGALPNGTNAYADTFLKPNTSLTLNSTHMSYYSRTSTSNSGIDDFGAYNGVNQIQRLLIKDSSNTTNLVDINSTSQRASGTVTDPSGFFIANRENSTSVKSIKNNTLLGSNSDTNTGTLPSVNMYLSALNNAGSSVNYSARQCAFASIGDGLTATELSNLYTAVQAYQTNLSRNV